jgi:hypothetical protein
MPACVSCDNTKSLSAKSAQAVVKTPSIRSCCTLATPATVSRKTHPGPDLLWGTVQPAGTVLLVLEAGARVPEVNVWSDIREEARPLKDVLGSGLSLLLFYLFDWSPT